MKTHKFFALRAWTLVAMFLVTGVLVAQTTFRKGAYYNLFPATDGRQVLELNGAKLKFQKMTKLMNLKKLVIYLKLNCSN